jgi:hypothetical protein
MHCHFIFTYIHNSVNKPHRRRRLLDHHQGNTHAQKKKRQEEEGVNDDRNESRSSSLLDLVVKGADSRYMAEACMCAFTQLQDAEGDIFERTRVIEYMKFWRDLSLLLGQCVFVCIIILCVLVVGY